MKYEDALKEWGARKLQTTYYAMTTEVDRDTVKVEMDFDAGDPCCGGYNPDCYCSMATSPSAHVTITGRSGRKRLTTTVEASSFDFVTVLKELVEVAEGTMTA